MSLSALKTIAGLAPMPTEVLAQIELIKFADSNHVLGQMAYAMKGGEKGALQDILTNGKLRAEHDHTMLKFEMDRLERAFVGQPVPIIVLKGGAYVSGGMRAGMGRRVSDLDILVRPEDIEKVETQLLSFGWRPDEETDNDYDQQYYREHMHELPPLRHKNRGTVIDVHHALLPKTARHSVKTERLFSDALPVGKGNLHIFQPTDLLIHSAVHAYSDGAIDTPARTILEQYFLFSELGPKDKKILVERAQEVSASMPVGLALWLVGRLFDVETAQEASKKLISPLRYFLLKRAILNKLAAGKLSVFGKVYLYIRSHYLRMPLYLLLPHLLRKAIRWRPGSNVPKDLPFPQ